MKTRDKPRPQRGAVVVEMAIVVTVLLLITAGIVEFGRIFWYYNALDKATRDGARFMSAVPAGDITDSAKAATAAATAKNLAVLAINAAGIDPPLPTGTGKVVVTCDGGACNGTKPTNVRVAIDNFQVTPGAWFPFVTAGGGYGVFSLAPSTTMRYMN